MIREAISITLALSCSTFVLAAELEVEARALFEEGTTLIEQNHHDSMIATREGLERGIDLVRRSVELGYPDTRNALLKVAAALEDLSFSYYQDRKEVSKDLLGYRDQLYRRLLELYPDSAEVLTESAFISTDEAVQEALLRRAVEADPSYAESSYFLGMALIRKGKFEEGIPMALRGVENSDALSLLSYGGQLLDLLRDSGRTEEAEAFKKSFQRLQREMLQPPEN